MIGHRPYEGAALFCTRCNQPRSASVHIESRYDDAPDSVNESIEAKFRDFHAENPQVYRELVKRARQIKEKGFDRYSIKTLYEVIRWNAHLTPSGEPFKLNNSFTALYARLIMDQERDLSGMFGHARGAGMNTLTRRLTHHPLSRLVTSALEGIAATLRRGISRHVSFARWIGRMGRYARRKPTTLCRRDIGALLRWKVTATGADGSGPISIHSGYAHSIRVTRWGGDLASSTPEEKWGR